ncbi:MAG: acyltransferase family protein [Terracidiphilus sp.]
MRAARFDSSLGHDRPEQPQRSGELDRSYRPDIDGLRALAILSVVLYHAGVPGVRGGFTGVDIFFAISGYLIGGHIYGELRAGCFSYLSFYRRRAKRILPAYFAVLAFILLAALVLLSPVEAMQTARSAFAATLSMSNILFWATANYFAAKTELNPVLMTWSLGVEEQFYAVIPLLMVLLARIRRNWLLPAVLATSALSFLFAWSLLGRYPMLVFYTLPARAWELGAGVALAAAELNRKSRQMPASKPSHPSRKVTSSRFFDSLRSLRMTAARVGHPSHCSIRENALAELVSLAGLASLLAPIFLLTAATPFPGPAALPSVLGTTLLIAVPANWINRRLLSLPPLVFIGKVSYSWYLWHWPLLALLRILYEGTPPLAAALQAAAAALAVAALSYYFIEQPFRRSARPPIPLLLRYAAVSLALLVACAVIWLGHGLPRRFPALARMEAAGETLKADPCLAGETDQPNLTPACFDASAARPSVALWGDSHAAAFAPALRSAANAQGYGFVELGKNSCTPLTGATHYIPRIPQLASECLRFNRTALGLLESDRSIRVVILAAAWAAPLYRNWMDGWLSSDLAREPRAPTQEATRRLYLESLTASIRALEGAGKQVIVLEDTPNFDFDPLLKVRTARIPARRALARWLGIQCDPDPGIAAPADDAQIAASVSVLEGAVAHLPGVALVDPKPALCQSSTQCAYRDGESLLYIDSSHLSPDGARLALRGLRFPAPEK